MKEPRQKTRREVRKSTDIWEQKQTDRQRFNFERVESPFSDLYAGIDPRRRQEVADSGMVQEDRQATANLSTIPVIKTYRKYGFYASPYIDDTEMD